MQNERKQVQLVFLTPSYSESVVQHEALGSKTWEKEQKGKKEGRGKGKKEKGRETEGKGKGGREINTPLLVFSCLNNFSVCV